MLLRTFKTVILSCLPFVAGCGNAAPSSNSVAIPSAERAIASPALESIKIAPSLDPQLIESVRRYVQHQVAAGFDTPEQIVVSAIEQNAIKISEDELKPLIEKFLKQSLAEHLAAQQKWPTVTDCERLDQAFRGLEAKGIFCRQNVRTHGSCGLILIKSEIDEQNKAGRTFSGYLIYYALDTDFAIEGRGLNLTFDSMGDDEPTAKNKSATYVGTIIIAALEANGLHPQWDGTIRGRIFVPMDWKRRR